MRKAVELIVTQGRTQRDAATLSGMDEKSLSRALKRPGVALYVEERKAQAVIDADGLKRLARNIAVNVGIELLRDAKSEQVKARMVEFFAGEPKTGALVTINQDMRALPPNVGYAYPSRLVSPPALDHQAPVPHADAQHEEAVVVQPLEPE